MAFDFSTFNHRAAQGDGRLDEKFVAWLINEQAVDMVLNFEKSWSYYRNDMQELSSYAQSGQASESSRPYRQKQEYGLPCRITGMNSSFFGGILAGREVEGVQRIA